MLAGLVGPIWELDSIRINEFGMVAAHRDSFVAALERCAVKGYRDLVKSACFGVVDAD